MYQGYPVELVPLLCCPLDNAELQAVAPSQTDPYLTQASLRCHQCGTHYPVEDGIVRLLDPAALDSESGHEHGIRDQQAVSYDPSTESSTWHRMEMLPTLAALEPLAGRTLLEMGCGNGRFTVRIAPIATVTIAVDFSLASLRTLARRLEPAWRIGLVQADATRISLRPGSFDRALSTLVSNLPTAEHRQRMLAIAASALRPDGRFVFSTHYHSLRSRLSRESRSRHYRAGGIYRYLFEPGEIIRETRPCFDRVACRPIQIAIPLAGRLGLPAVQLSRIAERLPLLRSLGELLLVEAEVPRPAH